MTPKNVSQQQQQQQQQQQLQHAPQHSPQHPPQHPPQGVANSTLVSSRGDIAPMDGAETARTNHAQPDARKRATPTYDPNSAQVQPSRRTTNSQQGDHSPMVRLLEDHRILLTCHRLIIYVPILEW